MRNVCRCDPGLLILKTDLLSLCHPELKRARAGEVGLGSWELHAWCTLQDSVALTLSQAILSNLEVWICTSSQGIGEGPTPPLLVMLRLIMCQFPLCKYLRHGRFQATHCLTTEREEVCVEG